MRPELGSRCSTKCVERGQRLGAGWPGSCRGPSRPMNAPRRRAPSGRGRRAPRASMSSSAGPPGLGDARASSAPFGGGWRLSWSKFHCPPTGSPPSTSTPCGRRASPVEVLHQQPLAAAAVGPALEVLARGGEAAGRQRSSAVRASRSTRPQRGVRRRVHDLDAVDLAPGLGVGRRPDVGEPVAELGGPVPHRATARGAPSPGGTPPTQDAWTRPSAPAGPGRRRSAVRAGRRRANGRDGAFTARHAHTLYRIGNSTCADDRLSQVHCLLRSEVQLRLWRRRSADLPQNR